MNNKELIELKKIEEVKAGDFASWFCDVDKIERSGVVQSIDKVIFECDVEVGFQLPEPDADFTSFGNEPIRYEAIIRTAEGKEFGIDITKLTQKENNE